jgi:5-methylcytosine-specific restriction endonuclease McrA
MRKWYVANRERARERMRKWYAANPERAREVSRRWRAANPERARQLRRQLYVANPEPQRQRSRQFRQENPEKVQRSLRKWREANRQRVLDYSEQWRAANPERAQASARAAKRKRSAAKRRTSGALAPRVTPSNTAERFLLFNNLCAYCGSDGPFHLDHVDPLARGGLHTPDNLAPACQRCNLSKSSKPVEAWYLGQPFFSPERWEALQAHTGRQWSAAEQLTLLSLL